MLPKKRRVKKKKEFERVFKKGKSFNNAFFIIKTLKNNLSFSRFALVVPLKIFKKATKRNKIKRLISESLKENYSQIREGTDTIFIAKKEVEKKEFREIKKRTEEVLSKADLIKND